MTGSSDSIRLLGRFAINRRVFVGAVDGGHVVETNLPSISAAFTDIPRLSGQRHRLSDLRVLAPVEKPSKIICVGLNFRSHIKEMSAKTPEVPLIFSKPSSAIINPGECIVLPPMSARVDYEGECAIIIKDRARKVEDGLRHIFGYTCFNDVTARDLQRVDPDWTRAKGFDTFAPIGPYISLTPPTRVTTRLNGEVMQSCELSDRVFDDAALVEYISTIMTLEPGDVIATGTPSGISPLKEGDVVDVELDGVGHLTNGVTRS